MSHGNALWLYNRKSSLPLSLSLPPPSLFLTDAHEQYNDKYVRTYSSGYNVDVMCFQFMNELNNNLKNRHKMRSRALFSGIVRRIDLCVHYNELPLPRLKMIHESFFSIRL